jgi:DNA-binding NarL/FixJ family response regulator
VHAHEPLTVFLVEDSPIIQQDLIATLEELAPVVVVGIAADERHALDWLADPTHTAGLVIVDLFLRSGSGLGVLRGAAQVPERRFVVLSNYAHADMRTQSLGLGADRVFDKSTEIDALIHYCRELAGKPAAPAARLTGSDRF